MEDQQGESVQEKYAKNSICFGCGPSNDEGLRIRSFRSGNGLKMEFNPSEKHQAFPGMINGGIIGTLLDCHGNWIAVIANGQRRVARTPLYRNCQLLCDPEEAHPIWCEDVN